MISKYRTVITSQSLLFHQFEGKIPIMAGKQSNFSGLFALITSCLLITASCAKLHAPKLYIGAEILEIVMNKTLPYDSNLTEEVKVDSILYNNLCNINIKLKIYNINFSNIL